MKKLFAGDKGMYAIVTTLFLLSLIVTFSTVPYDEILGSSSTAVHLFKQLVYILIGVVVIFLFSHVNYRKRIFKIGSLSLFAFSLVTSVLMLIIGIERDDAIRDLSIFGVSFQPFEFLKITFFFYLCYIFTKGYTLINSSLKYFELYVAAPVLLVCGLIFGHKSSSAIIIFAAFMLLCYVVKLNWKYVLSLVGVTVLAVTLVVLLKTNSRAATTGVSRVTDFVESVFSNDNVYKDIDDPKIAIGNGGLFGTFPGNSEVKYYLANAESDFVFSILVEEGGLLVGIFVVMVYVLFLFRVMMIMFRCQDDYGKLLAFGLGALIIVQVFVHLCVAVGLLPITGEQLPLVSRGGSSLVAYCIAIGVLQSVASHNVKKEKEVKDEIVENE